MYNPQPLPSEHGVEGSPRKSWARGGRPRPRFRSTCPARLRARPARIDDIDTNQMLMAANQMLVDSNQLLMDSTPEDSKDSSRTPSSAACAN